MSRESSLVRRVMVAIALGMIGLTMLIYALERTSLINFEAAHEGTDPDTPISIFITMFVGLAVVNLCAFWALDQWGAYLRAHPDVKQLPVWSLVLLIVLPGGGLVTSVATHAGYIRSLDTIPSQPNAGFVAFQVVMAALVILALVLLAARWAPGYKPPRETGRTV